jgi:hypothetical protein
MDHCGRSLYHVYSFLVIGTTQAQLECIAGLLADDTHGELHSTYCSFSADQDVMAIFFSVYFLAATFFK